MKKILALIMVIAVVLSLTACDNGEKSKTKVEDVKETESTAIESFDDFKGKY